MNDSGLVENFVSVLKKYKDFSGRARRREYWLFFLCTIVISVAFTVLAMIPAIGIVFQILSGLIGLALLLPGIMLCIRRLHDIGRPGTHLLFGLIPLAGGIILLLWYIKEGVSGSNGYGPDPKAA